jgi:hypothetical protein
MASLDSSDESLAGSSRRLLSVSRTTKRRRLVKLDEACDDSDDSADDDLWPRRASTAARRITTSSGGTAYARAPADSDDSVSTAELARRIRGTATPLSAATRTRTRLGTAPSPSVPLEIGRTQPYSGTLSPTQRTQRSSGVVGKKEAVFSLPRLGGDNTLPSPWRPRQRPTGKYADDEENDDSSAIDSDDNPVLSKQYEDPADDDDDSVSTAELARRIRGPPAKQQPQPAPLAASGSLRKENVLHPETDPNLPTMGADNDFFLPSPLPSEEDDESSLSGDDARDLPCVPPPPQQQVHPQPSSVAPPEPQWWEDEQEEPPDENPYDDDDKEPPPQKVTRASPPRQVERTSAIVREGLRSPLGPWARQRQLNATGGIFAHHPTLAPRRRSHEPPHHDDVTVVDDIGTFSDAEEGPASAAQSPPPVVGDHVQTRTRRRLPPVRSIRHTTDPSMAANVVPRGRSSANSSTTTAFGRSLAWPTRTTEFASSRNDLRGGSGVGAGQYEMIAPPPPASRARGGGGAGRGRGRGKKRGGRGRGRGRGRSRGASRGRGRGGGRGSSSSQGNAWSDYSTQTASWPSSQQGSNLGHVGGADISF